MEAIPNAQGASLRAPAVAAASCGTALPAVTTTEVAMPAHSSHFSVACYLGMMTYLLAILGRAHLAQRDPWSIGDWLINYRGGFVRRGLPGEIAWQCARVLHVSPAALVIAVQLLLYGTLLFCTWRLIRQSTCSLWIKAFLLSPATVAFPILDVEGGFRKEILLLAGLALLAVLLRRRALSPSAIGWYAAVAAAVLVLSHEAMTFYLPYWFAIVAISLRSARGAALLLLPAAVVAVVGWVVVIHHAGNAAIAQRICASLGPAGSDYCSGSIAALGDTQAKAHAMVALLVGLFHPVGLYVALAFASLLPAVVPLVSLARHRDTRWEFRVVMGSALASTALSGVLFVYALDWGRWIYIHAYCLFLVLLLVDLETPGHMQRPGEHPSAWWYVPLLLFATTWGVPRMPGPSPVLHGYIGYLHLFQK